MSLNYTIQIGNITEHLTLFDSVLSSETDAQLYQNQFGAQMVDYLKFEFPSADEDRSNGETKTEWAIPISGAPQPVLVTELQRIQREAKNYSTPTAGEWQRDAKGNIVLDDSHGPVWIATPPPPPPPPVTNQGKPAGAGGIEGMPLGSTYATHDDLNKLSFALLQKTIDQLQEPPK